MSGHVPPSAMPLVSPTALLSAHLKQSPPTRPSNRAPLQPRPIELNTGSLTHSNGSSLVKIGATSIVCGVRAEILLVSDIPSFRVSKSTSPSTSNQNNEQDLNKGESALSLYNLLVPNIELAIGCSPLHPANTAPSIEAQSLSQRILSLLLTSTLVRLRDLEIWHTPELLDGQSQEEEPQLKAYWTLYIDMVCISHAGSGSVFDAAWLALCAALKDTMLPRAVWDIDDLAVYCSPDIAEARRLELRGMPVPLSFGGFEGRVLVDLDGLEEECTLERGCVVVDDGDGDGGILRVEKSGGAEIGGKEIEPVLEVARERWREWRKVLGGG